MAVVSSCNGHRPSKSLGHDLSTRGRHRPCQCNTDVSLLCLASRRCNRRSRCGLGSKSLCRWELGDNIREVFAEVAEMKKDVLASLANVYSSTSYPTVEGMKLCELPYGIVATKSVDDSIEYIHVLNPPTDGSKSLILPLPLDGKVFLSGEVLRSGSEVGILTLEDDGDKVMLEIGDDEEWDEINTVIALKVDMSSLPDSSKNLAIHRPVIYSSAVQCEPKWTPKSGFGSIRVNDGITSVFPPPQSWAEGNYGWSSERFVESCQQWVGVNLPQETMVSKVVLYPRADDGNEGEGFPVRISVEVSMDKEEWQCVLESEEEIPQCGDPWIAEFGAVSCRYVRVVGLELRPRPLDGLFTMQVVEMEIYGGD